MPQDNSFPQHNVVQKTTTYRLPRFMVPEIRYYPKQVMRTRGYTPSCHSFYLLVPKLYTVFPQFTSTETIHCLTIVYQHRYRTLFCHRLLIPRPYIVLSQITSTETIYCLAINYQYWDYTLCCNRLLAVRPYIVLQQITCGPTETIRSFAIDYQCRSIGRSTHAEELIPVSVSPLLLFNKCVYKQSHIGESRRSYYIFAPTHATVYP